MLTVKEVAAKLMVSPQTVRNYAVRGLLKPNYITPSGKRFYDEQNVEEFYQKGVLSYGNSED